MSVPASAVSSDRPVALLTVLGIVALALIVQAEIATRDALLFLVGIGFGISLLHASFGFTGGWRQMVRQRRSAGVRAQLLLLAVTSILFFPLLGQLVPGIEVGGAIAPVGISVLVGAFLFGIGMQLGGGCGSGTLFTVGGGHVKMLITLGFFIVGATVGSAHLHWWLALPNVGKVSLIESMGWLPALGLQLAVLALLYWLARGVELKRHGSVASIRGQKSAAPLVDRLVFGPWPLVWGVAGLALFNLLTMLLAGHPWSITFAFGLWGAKIANAIGFDVLSWPYWSTGYPLKALTSSVLADVTSLMDFGLVIGAILASALAGKFAPESKLPWNSIAAAVVGGLLLGYGARLAFGCNIGALLGGISSGSLHGWLWLVSGFAGSWLGVYLRVNFKLDPPTGKTA
jgi:uncharacterized membrane protein YedE/YeeE